MSVYVLKFDQPIGGEKHQAQHYIGKCEDGRELERLAEHRARRGAKITRAVAKKGIGMEIIAVFPGDYVAEYWLKRRQNIRRFLERYFEDPTIYRPVKLERRKRQEKTQ